MIYQVSKRLNRERLYMFSKLYITVFPTEERIMTNIHLYLFLTSLATFFNTLEMKNIKIVYLEKNNFYILIKDERKAERIVKYFGNKLILIGLFPLIISEEPFYFHEEINYHV